ncbi:MAG: carbohydrate ABC transporter permease [Meiothermus sp.]
MARVVNELPVQIGTARSNEPRRRLPRDLPRFLLLCVLAVIFLTPIYWMLSTSLKPESDTIAQPVQWVPARPTLDNYKEILTSPDGNILRWTWNSVVMAVSYTVVSVALCVLAAYPLARMRFWGREGLFWFILSSMMVPGIVTLIPLYIMMIQLGWIDTYHALIWPGVAQAFGVFMLRQFFLGIPKELEEAARMDGANSLQVLRHVILPLSVPALVTLGVFSFMASWNNYVWPLFVVHGDMQTLPVGITLFSSRYVTDYGKLMAGTAIAALPVLVAYLFAQRYLVQGIALTGLKE